ncbi:MAG: Gfo/Idh/MocA family oxidoreductase, partial [bacterium]
MDKKIKIGIMGVGMIGDVHIKNIRKDGRGKVIWIASRTQKTLDRKMKKFDISQGTLDYREILQDPQVEAVIIASPPHTHSEMALAALEAGKHILLEKPMAISYEEVKQITTAVRKHPEQLVLECSCRHARLQPKFPFIKQIIDSGKLGKVYHIHHNHLMRRTFIEYNPAGKWSLEKEKAGGGPFLDQGVYDLSFHLGLLGDVPNLTSIKSFTKKGLKTFPDKSIHQDIEEHGAAYMEFDAGLTYYYERGAGVHCDVNNETRICGTKGGLRFGFNSW